MTTRKMVVLGAYANRAGANHAVDELTSAGFEVAEISFLSPDDRGFATVENANDREPRDISAKATELTFKETKDISSGQVRGCGSEKHQNSSGGGNRCRDRRSARRHIGMFAALTGLVVPGIGPLLIAGPLFGAFAGATAGGAVECRVGTRNSRGRSKTVRRTSKEGGIMVSVHAESDTKVNRATTILKNTGPPMSRRCKNRLVNRCDEGDSESGGTMSYLELVVAAGTLRLCRLLE